jgi:SAM-dependent methyltransferase
MSSIKHIPYAIDPKRKRLHHYETVWKTSALDLLQAHAGVLSGMTLLDYGCGRGETLSLATQRGIVASGTDLDPECVRLAGRFGHTEILNPREPLSQFGTESFDVVTCFHVLEHVPNPKATLTALTKIARRYVIVAVPNLSAFHDLVRTRKWVIKINEGHLQSWDHSHFRNLAETHCGLEILQWGFDATIIPPLSGLFQRIFGQAATIKLETTLFKSLFPYASLSVIALMRPVDGFVDPSFA